jgi:hypothetical protein
MAWAVAGGEDHIDLHARQLEPLAAADGVVGLVALEGAEARPGDECVDIGEHRRLYLGAPDGRARRLGDRGNRADVVEVRVGQEDSVDRHPQLLRGTEDPLGLIPGVDDEGLV